MDARNSMNDEPIYHQRTWELLGKKAAGEADENELEELQELLKGQKENAQYMMNVMDYYWKSVQKASEPEEISNVSEQYQKEVMDKIALENQARVVAMDHKKRWIWAAAILLCLIGSWFVYHNVVKPGREMNIVITKNGSKTKVTLPDGTQVWLNVGSKLTYPNDFKHVSKREITLSGEAYFNVKHDADCPFIIHTDDLDIKDLGTIFNVRAYPKDHVTEATLISGSIEIILRDNPYRKLKLKPHEKVSYYDECSGFKLQKDKQSPSKEQDTKKLHSLKQVPARLEVTAVRPMVLGKKDTIVVETAWIKNQMVFRSEDFSHLAERMERWYNVKINIHDEAIKKYTFTGIFQGETLEQALKELQMIRPFQYRINKNEVIIAK